MSGIVAFPFAVQSAAAVGTAVDLGTAGAYSALASESVTNTGPSVLNRDVGVSPGSSITGFPPGIVLGTVHQTDAHALQAASDLTTAYNFAAGQAPDDADIPTDLGGLTLTPGVYKASSSVGITGTLSLDAEGDPNAVFIFQIGSALTTASSSTVALVDGARSCNVFWQIGSSATLGTDTTFVGTMMAQASITANTGADIDGRALALDGSVSLDTNVFTGSDCARVPGPTETPPLEPTPPVASPVPPIVPPVVPPVVPGTPPVVPGPPPVVPGTPPGTPGTPPGTPGGPPPVPEIGAPPASSLPPTPSLRGSGPGAPQGGLGRGSDATLPETGTSADAGLLGIAAVAVLLGGGLILTGIRRSRRTAP